MSFYIQTIHPSKHTTNTPLFRLPAAQNKSFSYNTPEPSTQENAHLDSIKNPHWIKPSCRCKYHPSWWIGRYRGRPWCCSKHRPTSKWHWHHWQPKWRFLHRWKLLGRQRQRSVLIQTWRDRNRFRYEYRATRRLLLRRRPRRWGWRGRKQRPWWVQRPPSVRRPWGEPWRIHREHLEGSQ